MTGDKVKRKSARIDGEDYPEHVNIIDGIRSNAPCLLSKDLDAVIVRKWFRENDSKCNASLGWIESLYMVSLEFKDDGDLGLPQSFLEWREMPKPKKDDQIKQISEACEGLIAALEACDLPFDKLKIRDVEVFNGYWNMRINEGIELDDYQQGYVRPWSDVEPLHGDGVGNIPLVSLLRDLGENVGGFSHFDGLKKPKEGLVSSEVIKFGRLCLRRISEEFKIRDTPNKEIASLVSLRFPGCGVIGKDVGNWKR